MIQDRDTYFKANAKKAEKAQQAQRPQLRYLAQAAVSAGNLTGNENWDFFLSLIQSDIELVESRLAGYQAMLNDQNVVDPNDMLIAKIAMAECNGMLRAMASVIALPNQIKQNGAQAQTLLSQIKPENEHSDAA